MNIALLRVAISGLMLYVGQSSTQTPTHHTVTTHRKTATTTRSATATRAKTSTKTISGTKTVTAVDTGSTNKTTAKNKTPPAPLLTGSAVPSADARAALEFHNAKRAEVGVSALQWSPELATAAQAWADHLAKDLQCKMQHSPNSPYGENIFAGRGKAYTALEASQYWYAEKLKYAGGEITMSNYSSSGHYTQMMWQTTTQVGIGLGSCNGSLVIVAKYSPHGNVLGQKPY